MYIDKILDLKMIDIPSPDDFYNFLKKDISKVFNLYLNDTVNDFCNKFIEGAYNNTSKRETVEKEIKAFTEKSNKLLFLKSPSKIGKSVTILKVLNKKKFLYIDFKYLSELDNNNKRKYIFKEFFRLFDYYYEYEFFLKKYYNKFQYSDNYLNFINNIIQIVMANFISQVIIVIDNYDDLYSNKEELSNYFIENIILCLRNTKHKLIICGNGIFFNSLISEYFSNNNMKYEFIYIDSLELDLEDNNNTYLNYLEKKYNGNITKKIFFLILFKKAMNNVTGFSDFKNISDFPSQFFIFKKNKDGDVIINFYKKDVINLLEKNIKFHLLNDLTFFDLKIINNLSIKGIVLEEIIINLIEIRKLIEGFEITDKNIIRVKEIISINDDTIQNNNIDNNKNILIKQTNNFAESIDICLIINDCAFFIQIGIK